MDGVALLPPSISIGRVKMSDLIPAEGLPCNSYKLSVSTLTQSLSHYSAVILELSPADAALLLACLHSARLYFHQHRHQQNSSSPTDSISIEWCRTSGYYADPQLLQETYDYRPGLTLLDPHPHPHPHSDTDTDTDTPFELSPSALPDVFRILGKAARCVLDAVSYSLNLRSCSFNDILDNVPLRNQDVSSSVLSVCCHSGPLFVAARQDGQAAVCPIDYEHQVDKTLVTVIKPDKPGLQIKDLNGQWVLADTNLGPHEVVVYPGLALYQATAGYVVPALHRTDVGVDNNLYGRCSAAFKLMPKSMASLSCTEMQAAGYGVDPRFQNAIPVTDFMQRSHPVDQLFPRNGAQPMLNEGQDGNFSLARVLNKLLRHKDLGY